MKEELYVINTVEEWYCTETKRNVRVATATSDGSRRCMEMEYCKKGRNCKNAYINNYKR